MTGYAGSWSADQGTALPFYLSSPTTIENVAIPILDTNGRQVDTLTATVSPQEIANVDPWKNGFGYQVTSSYQIPNMLPSGLYKLDGTIPFVVKEQNSATDVVVVFPSNNANAYTRSGGRSLYSADTTEVSFLRPQNSYEVDESAGFDRWLTGTQFDYRYIADYDMEHYEQIEKSKLLVIAGHSEYWTRQARENFDRFIAEGGSALLIAGNSMYRPVELDNADAPTKLLFSQKYVSRHNLWVYPELGLPTIESIGSDYTWGGAGSAYGSGIVVPDTFDGWKVLDNTRPYFEGTGVDIGDIIHNPTGEYDGAPRLGFAEDGTPIIDTELLGFYDFNLIAYDNALIGEPLVHSTGTWIEFQKTPTSGRVIVVGSVNWAYLGGNTPELKKQLTSNMMDYLLAFTPRVLDGDFDGDGSLLVSDVDLLAAEVCCAPSANQAFDLNQDQAVDLLDVEALLALAGRWNGDADFDGRVLFPDFVTLAASFGQAGNWSDGDFNADGVVRFADFVVMASNFGKSGRHEGKVSTVPEGQISPSLAVFLWAISRRRRPAQVERGHSSPKL